MSYLEKFRLDGRTAFVTGGGQGIGLACAQALEVRPEALVRARAELAGGEAA